MKIPLTFIVQYAHGGYYVTYYNNVTNTGGSNPNCLGIADMEQWINKIVTEYEETNPYGVDQ